jgi:DNA-binding CsgD family transcriptional regulator/PAS domain-containing protein
MGAIVKGCVSRGAIDRELAALCTELDTVRLDEPRHDFVDQLHRVLETDITGFFAFDSSGSLQGFQFAGMPSSALSQYRHNVMRTDRAWGFFEPWAIPASQRNAIVVCQPERFLRGCPATRRRLGLTRGAYERLHRAFEAHTYPFYERHGYLSLWHLRVLLAENGRLIGWVGGMCERVPTREQRRRLRRLLPSLRRHAEFIRRTSDASRPLVDALLEQLSRPSFIVNAQGRILHANRRGLDALRDAAVHDHIHAAAELGDHPGSAYDVVPIAARGLAALRLVTERSCSTVPDPARFELTPRQAGVAAELCTGASNHAIATRLGIAERTVEVHLTAIYARLGVVQRSAAIARLLGPS